MQPLNLRMKFKKKHNKHAEIDMAPLIDMVFLLLIFFMCTATMSQVDLTPDVALPVAPDAKVPDDMRNRGVVNILPDKRFMISGQIVDQSRMLTLLKKQFKSNPNTKLYLRADKTVPFVEVKKVMRACAQAGISDIIFGSFQSYSR